MNFLAHAWLAGEAPADRLGGLIGDFVKGELPGALPLAVADGVRLHRELDRFADTHPVFLRSCARVPVSRRRVAGVMVDMFYDHFLARHWGDFDDRPLPEFTAAAYHLMQQHDALLPQRLQGLLPDMRESDWLASYADADKLSYALDRMARRLSRPELLAGSGAELLRDYAGFEADFRAFLPEAVQFMHERRTRRLSRAG